MTTAEDYRARLVRVWLGEHVIVSYENEPALAATFEEAMRRRYASCRVTNDPAGYEDAAAATGTEVPA